MGDECGLPVGIERPHLTGRVCWCGAGFGEVVDAGLVEHAPVGDDRVVDETTAAEEACEVSLLPGRGIRPVRVPLLHAVHLLSGAGAGVVGFLCQGRRPPSNRVCGRRWVVLGSLTPRLKPRGLREPTRSLCWGAPLHSVGAVATDTADL
jgi:hypothetical protein